VGAGCSLGRGAGCVVLDWGGVRQREGVCRGGGCSLHCGCQAPACKACRFLAGIRGSVASCQDARALLCSTKFGVLYGSGFSAARHWVVGAQAALPAPGAAAAGKLLQDWRRINVAITRAKSKLVLVGNSETLCTLPMFEQLLGIVRSRGWYLRLPSGAAGGCP
jgi:hypothetical protein